MYEVKSLYKQFGTLPVLHDINLQVSKGKIVALLGPSGCGKTTLIKILAGLITADTGLLTGFSQQCSYVFQTPRLIPWRTVGENISLVLQDIMSEAEIKQVLNEVLAIVELLDVAGAYPNRLSGGMQQRVSIARALAIKAALIFLDEPFQSLDFDLKQRLMRRLLPLWSDGESTVFLVTHDIHVAVTLGDIICLMNQRPSTIAKQLYNPVPREQRIIGNNRLLTELEDNIYAYLTI